MTRTVAVLLALAAIGGCSESRRERESGRVDAVLYTIGLSTDPYGSSAPHGFGVATGLGAGRLRRVEIRVRGLGSFTGADWIDGRNIFVPRKAPPLRPPFVYRYEEGKLRRNRTVPIQSTSSFAWSPDRRLIAVEPARPCKRKQVSLFSCYRSSGEIFVLGRDGSRRRKLTAGHLQGWTVDGRIVFFRSYQRATPLAIDPRTRRTGPVLPGWQVEPPLWSRDRRYVAAVTGAGILIARSDGRPVQRIRSRLVISMIAWAPSGARLAYTTSGFPDPHQLFVLDAPRAKPRLLYATGAEHFDWVTWSPDGCRLLLDEEHRGRWLLLRTDRSREPRPLPRLGGRPLWCCPVNTFAASGSRRQ